MPCRASLPYATRKQFGRTAVGGGLGIKPPGRIQGTHSSYQHRTMKAVVLLVCVAFVASKPTGDEDVLGSVVAVVRSCSEKDVALCLKVCLCFVSSVCFGLLKRLFKLKVTIKFNYKSLCL